MQPPIIGLISPYAFSPKWNEATVTVVVSKGKAGEVNAILQRVEYVTQLKLGSGSDVIIVNVREGISNQLLSLVLYLAANNLMQEQLARKYCNLLTRGARLKNSDGICSLYYKNAVYDHQLQLTIRNKQIKHIHVVPDLYIYTCFHVHIFGSRVLMQYWVLDQLRTLLQKLSKRPGDFSVFRLPNINKLQISIFRLTTQDIVSALYGICGSFVGVRCSSLMERLHDMVSAFASGTAQIGINSQTATPSQPKQDKLTHGMLLRLSTATCPELVGMCEGASADYILARIGQTMPLMAIKYNLLATAHRSIAAFVSKASSSQIYRNALASVRAMVMLHQMYEGIIQKPNVRPFNMADLVNSGAGTELGKKLQAVCAIERRVLVLDPQAEFDSDANIYQWLRKLKQFLKKIYAITGLDYLVHLFMGTHSFVISLDNLNNKWRAFDISCAGQKMSAPGLMHNSVHAHVPEFFLDDEALYDFIQRSGLLFDFGLLVGMFEVVGLQHGQTKLPFSVEHPLYKCQQDLQQTISMGYSCVFYLGDTIASLPLKYKCHGVYFNVTGNPLTLVTYGNKVNRLLWLLREGDDENFVCFVKGGFFDNQPGVSSLVTDAIVRCKRSKLLLVQLKLEGIKDVNSVVFSLLRSIVTQNAVELVRFPVIEGLLVLCTDGQVCELAKLAILSESLNVLPYLPLGYIDGKKQWSNIDICYKLLLKLPESKQLHCYRALRQAGLPFPTCYSLAHGILSYMALGAPDLLQHVLSIVAYFVPCVVVAMLKTPDACGQTPRDVAQHAGRKANVKLFDNLFEQVQPKPLGRGLATT